MIKKILLLSLLASSSFAATTISTTLTMTSPSAVISMTGISSTAYLANISSTNVAASTVSSSLISASTITGPLSIAKAWVYFDGSGSCTIRNSFNVASCSRQSAGAYGISFTTPMQNANYIVNCIPQAPALFVPLSSSPSATTAGFNITTANTGSSLDNARTMCTIYGN